MRRTKVLHLIDDTTAGGVMRMLDHLIISSIKYFTHVQITILEYLHTNLKYHRLCIQNICPVGHLENRDED